MYSEADSECGRREKGHWEIVRDSVCALTWCKRDSWLEFDPDKDRKQISMSVLESSVDERRLLVLQMTKNRNYSSFAGFSLLDYPPLVIIARQFPLGRSPLCCLWSE